MELERIQLSHKEIVLVGTAHISRASVELVRETIEKEKPGCVGIELDAQRFHQLQNQSRWQQTNVGSIIQEGKTYLLLLNIFLANIQRRLGESVQVKPGQEMLTAAQIAAANHIPIALLDRSIEITMKRAFSLTPLREKLRVLAYFLGGTFGESDPLTIEKVEALKQSDVVSQLIQELGEKAPTIKKVLVDERDSFIANQILKYPAQKMVCVIGAGHLQGIKALLLQHKTVSENALLQVPHKRGWIGLLKWIIPIFFVAVLGWALFTKDLGTSLNIILYWVVATGSFSAIGALVSRAHPLSILTAFAVAPLTTIHPLLASGWFAAAVEAKFRHPKVRDFESLNKLNSYGDFEKNKVTHLLLVAAYTNVCSMIGVIVALPAVLSLLA